MTPLKGLTLVFTGRMKKVRKEMEADAKALGAWVDDKVNHNTDYLITGKNVGKVKTEAAEAKGVKVITVDQYEELVRERTIAAGNNTAKKEPARKDSLIDPLGGYRPSDAVQF